MYGKTHSEETRKLLRQKIPKSKDYYRSINQYDLDGNFIKTWKDSSEIYDSEFKPYCAVIKKCCYRQKHYLTACNYQWRYIDDCEDIGKLCKIKSPTKVRQLYEVNPINGDIIKHYNSITECSNELNLSFRRIMDCCRGVTISVDKRLFIYVEDYDSTLNERLIRYNNKYRHN